MRALLTACAVLLLAGCELMIRGVGTAAYAVVADRPPPPTWGSTVPVGRLDAGGFFPAGDLFFLPANAYSLDDSSRHGWLILDVDAPPQGNARSYVMRLSADCKSKEIAVGYVLTFEGVRGRGREMTRQELKPAKVLGPADTARPPAYSALCETPGVNEFDCRMYGRC